MPNDAFTELCNAQARALKAYRELPNTETFRVMLAADAAVREAVRRFGGAVAPTGTAGVPAER